MPVQPFPDDHEPAVLDVFKEARIIKWHEMFRQRGAGRGGVNSSTFINIETAFATY
jgi:hypothetical protein